MIMCLLGWSSLLLRVRRGLCPLVRPAGKLDTHFHARNAVEQDHEIPARLLHFIVLEYRVPALHDKELAVLGQKKAAFTVREIPQEPELREVQPRRVGRELLGRLDRRRGYNRRRRRERNGRGGRRRLPRRRGVLHAKEVADDPGEFFLPAAEQE